jgi:hypothetical protein
VPSGKLRREAKYLGGGNDETNVSKDDNCCGQIETAKEFRETISREKHLNESKRIKK